MSTLRIFCDSLVSRGFGSDSGVAAIYQETAGTVVAIRWTDLIARYGQTRAARTG